MSIFTFSKNIVYHSTQLPLTLMSLEDWSLIYIEGFDSQKYLNSQLTIDMYLLKRTNHALCAHCNINGRVLSTMRIFFYNKGYACIVRKNIVDLQLKELQKYSIFSKVIIKKLDNKVLLGLSGLNAKKILLSFFSQIPDKNVSITYQNMNAVLWIKQPLERFLLVFSLYDSILFKKEIKKVKYESITFNNSQQWLSLEIESGIPIIDKKSAQKFTPQSLNLDKLKAISFYKGCYYGQEKIAKIFFKNLNKRFLCYLTGKGDISPKIGSFIEVDINGTWMKVGIIISIVFVKDKKIWIQGVLNKSINIKSVFRICGFSNIFFIKK